MNLLVVDSSKEQARSDDLAAIEFRNCSFSYGDRPILDDISFSVTVGEVVGLLGANGAGKTTMLKLLLGLLSTQRGSVKLFGRSHSTVGISLRREVAWVPESSSLYQRLSVIENLRFVGEAYNLDAAPFSSRVDRLLRGFEMTGERNRSVKSLSNGQRRKVALIRALMTEAPLLILDEPTAGLDLASAVELRQQLSSMTKSLHTTILLTSHLMLDIVDLCQRVMVLHRGHIRFDGSPQRLASDSALPAVYATCEDMTAECLSAIEQIPAVDSVELDGNRLSIFCSMEPDVAQINRTLVKYGANVREIRRDLGTMDQSLIAMFKDETLRAVDS